MIKRLTWAILLTVWLTLVVVGVVDYVATRAVLLQELDASLMRRATGLAEPGRQAESGGASGDRFIVRNEVGKTLQASPSRQGSPKGLKLTGGKFARLADGREVRTITVELPAEQAGGRGVTIVYSGSAELVLDQLRRLALVLGTCGIAAGLICSGVAHAVSRAIFKPLGATSTAIENIDEQTLDRRIDVAALPPELRPIAVRLNELLERLEVAVARRKQFVADAAHELRTPVAALLATVELALRRPRSEAELTEALRTALSEARMLSRLAQALLEEAAGTGSASSDSPSSFDLAELLDACAEVADGLGASKGTRVRRRYERHIKVCGDARRLRTIVMNLLGNAVEHNRAGRTIDLDCQVRGKTLELSVTDDGDGIPAEQQGRIFEPFFKANRESDSGHEHLGLGLYLVQSHVKAMKGVCQVRSEAGSGTSFRVEAPIEVEGSSDAGKSGGRSGVEDDGAAEAGVGERIVGGVDAT